MSEVDKLIIDYCEKNKVTYRDIILHGSQSIGFANEYSDYDYLVFVDEDKYGKIDTFVDIKKRKIQVEFMTIENLKKELEDYESRLMKTTMDLNLIAGRIYMGKRIIKQDKELDEIMERYRPFLQKKKLIEKFVLQAVNFYSDCKTTDEILRKYSINMMAKSIGIAFLISKDVYWLNIKWQHKFLEKLMNAECYDLYSKLRFHMDNLRDEDISIYSKKILKLIEY